MSEEEITTFRTIQRLENELVRVNEELTYWHRKHDHIYDNCSTLQKKIEELKAEVESKYHSEKDFVTMKAYHEQVSRNTELINDLLHSKARAEKAERERMIYRQLANNYCVEFHRANGWNCREFKFIDEYAASLLEGGEGGK